MFKKFVFKKISTIEIPKSSKLHRYVNKVRKLYHARYKCNNKRDPKIIGLNKMAILRESSSHMTRGDEDIGGGEGAPKILRHQKGGSEKIRGVPKICILQNQQGSS